MMLKREDLLKIQMEPDEFYKGSREAKKFKKVTEKIITEERNKLIDEVDLKRGEDWSILSNQVVGSEHL